MAENILVQGFCPLKIKITQFPDGFHLNIVKPNFTNTHFIGTSCYYGPFLCS